MTDEEIVRMMTESRRGGGRGRQRGFPLSISLRIWAENVEEVPSQFFIPHFLPIDTHSSFHTVTSIGWIRGIILREASNKESSLVKDYYYYYLISVPSLELCSWRVGYVARGKRWASSHQKRLRRCLRCPWNANTPPTSRTGSEYAIFWSVAL